MPDDGCLMRHSTGGTVYAMSAKAEIMRKLLTLPVLSLLVGTLLPAQVKAQTWITVARDEMNFAPGTLGYQMNMGGFLWQVDAQSMVRRGDRVYFNVALQSLDRNHRTKDEKRRASGWEADCSSLTFSRDGREWESVANTEHQYVEPIIRFVCR